MPIDEQGVGACAGVNCMGTGSRLWQSHVCLHLGRYCDGRHSNMRANACIAGAWGKGLTWGLIPIDAIVKRSLTRRPLGHPYLTVLLTIPSAKARDLTPGQRPGVRGDPQSWILCETHRLRFGQAWACFAPRGLRIRGSLRPPSGCPRGQTDELATGLLEEGSSRVPHGDFAFDNHLDHRPLRQE